MQETNGIEKYKEGDIMANISQNVNIEMLEKLADGTYKRKYPKTRSDTGVTFDEHLADIVSQEGRHGLRYWGRQLEIKVDGEWIGAGAIPLDPLTWKGVQAIVREGLAGEHFSVGDQLVSGYDGGQIIWEVIGIDVDTPAESGLTHSMTLQTKDCLHDIQFDAPEPTNPDSDRKSYGNNRYIHSAVKQWLNSDEAAFQWKSQHQYDAKPTDSLGLYNGAGFLYRLDPELAAVIGEVSKKVALNTATDGGGQESFNDKVFLLSQKEVGLGEEGDATGEFVYPFYDGISNAGRIKQLNGSNRYWWLRSPYVSISSGVRSVDMGGTLSNILAYYAIGVSPACVII